MAQCPPRWKTSFQTWRQRVESDARHWIPGCTHRGDASQSTREIHRLRKKHRDIVDYITPFERLLSKDMRSGHQQYPGLGLTRPPGPASIWKARVVYPPLGGASSGLRYVYERLDIEDEIVIVALKVYVHQSGIKESGVIRDIKNRSGAILPSRAELWTLEKPDLSE